jgi:hypothetical protein
MLAMSYKVRTIVFMLYIWTCIIYQFTRFVDFILMCIISYIPNILVPNISSKTPVRILRATDQYGNDITKKLKLFMRFRWDYEINNEEGDTNNGFDINNGYTGGIDLDAFIDYIGASVIWIAYVFEYDIDDIIFSELINLIHSSKLFGSTKSHVITKPIEYFRRTIRFLSIVTEQKMMYKLNNDAYPAPIKKEPITFGEINFN